MPNVPSISALDAQLLAATAMLSFGITATGNDGVEMLNELEQKHPDIAMFIQTALILLTKNKPLKLDDAVINDPAMSRQERAKILSNNFQHIAKLSKALLIYASGEVAGEPRRILRVKEVAPDGTPILDEPETPETEPASRLYNLVLTHDELHIVSWAVRIAEQLIRKDVPAVLMDGDMYFVMRREVVTDAAFDQFVEKLGNAHRQARVDSGEEE